MLRRAVVVSFSRSTYPSITPFPPSLSHWAQSWNVVMCCCTLPVVVVVAAVLSHPLSIYPLC